MLCIIYVNCSLNYILLVNDFFLVFFVIRRIVFEIRCGNFYVLLIKFEDICLYIGFLLCKYFIFIIFMVLCKFFF